MKQPKRNFVIEYKSGRRRSAATQSSSIWGNLDLKSVAEAVEADLPKPASGIDGPAEVATSKHSAQDIVTKRNAPTNHICSQHGEDVGAGVDPGALVDHALGSGTEAIDANDVGSLAKDNATGETARSEPSGAEQKRRRVRKSGARVTRMPVQPILAKPKLVSRSEADKELADLFQLEEENRQLRRLLIVKLHEENGWLRERLQRG
ncbi:hypothetical protein SAMN03159496_06037 [Rhizobium sp. NFR07]|uniref:hypothetical protein n=1 Tax=Rhizobium sp. NFR07 TaxID=1566262 RepID=UPI0008ECF81C|nr:hypothetical protein [Rhizobium sp. NFR07]SFB62479.1 hypothetical protein SAMN03159496_06037 [Rhizobium sp. NFR07]